MCDLRNVSSAKAIPGRSSSATSCEYGQLMAGPSSRAGAAAPANPFAGPRLSLDISEEGREVKSVLGVPELALAERVGADEASVNGEGGVV
jgi:hypothetical protein